MKADDYFAEKLEEKINERLREDKGYVDLSMKDYITVEVIDELFNTLETKT